jgi:catechol 2,3-dioxygenase-like lactoylglutathione lyase family enzyme
MNKTLAAAVAGLLSIAAAHASGQALLDAQTVVKKEVLPMAAKMAEATQVKVEDVGGVFIYSNDAKALAEWYKDKLGIGLVNNAAEGNYYFVFVRGSGAGANTVFAIKPAKSKLAAERNQFAVNFRVNDFDGFLKRLEAKGVALDRTQDYPGFGRFGWLKDLDGNPIEFWQPAK